LTRVYTANFVSTNLGEPHFNSISRSITSSSNGSIPAGAKLASWPYFSHDQTASTGL